MKIDSAPGITRFGQAGAIVRKPDTTREPRCYYQIEGAWQPWEDMYVRLPKDMEVGFICKGAQYRDDFGGTHAAPEDMTYVRYRHPKGSWYTIFRKDHSGMVGNPAPHRPQTTLATMKHNGMYGPLALGEVWRVAFLDALDKLREFSKIS